MQCVAVHCSVVQFLAVHCSGLLSLATPDVACGVLV